MPQQNYLCRRKSSSCLYFRIRVPTDLVGEYGRSEIKRSLGTSDPRTAKLRAQELALRLMREFDERRKKLQPSQPGMVLDGSDASIELICKRWKHHVLAGDEAFRLDRPDEDELTEFRENRTAVQPLLKKAIADGKVDIVEPALSVFLDLLNVELQCDDESYQRLRYKFAQTLAQTNELQLQRNEGTVIETPASPDEYHVSLDDVFESWAQMYNGGRAKTVDRAKSIIHDFKACIGPKPADAVTKADVTAFRDQLLSQRRLQPKTVETRLALLRAVFEVSVDDGKLPSNPVSRIRVPKSTSAERRLPFSQDDLAKIFFSGIYTNHERPRGGKGEAAAWLPTLALFTGCRLEELGQLRVEDVNSQEDIWYLDICESNDGGTKTRLKTEASWRKVPLHPQLIKAGFLDYVETIRQARHSRLFPALKPDKYGIVTSQWSKWFHRYLREKIRLTSKQKVFHSFRHSFRDACREAELEEEIANALMGHSAGGTGRKYGASFSLKRLHAAIKKISYNKLKVPKINSHES